MKYFSIVPASFLSRPNRFIARVLIGNKEELVHVKNTGRCKELLLPGATIYLEPSNNPSRKTKYSLIAVQKGNRLINIDSQAPNKVLEEALLANKKLEGFPSLISKIRREYTHGSSRLDFMLETKDKPYLVEVKGVTLEQEGIVLFPDAPTERGIKHLNELTLATQQGYGCIACFVIQMEHVSFFTPNYATHPEFGKALQRAGEAGVIITAFDCTVSPNSLVLNNSVPIKLT